MDDGTEYLRRFYQATAAGAEAVREWKVDAWTQNEWDKKFEVCNHKQQPQ
jgi:DNA-binding PadR family transcriptional regulator